MKTKAILPADFHLRRYGIDVRLVQEDDASFIISLRTNERLSRFIHQTDNDEQKQRLWIRNYKEREKAGRDYYFIYSRDGVPFGLNRIYDIHDDLCTGGSWLCVPGTSVNDAISTSLIARDIMFGYLGMREDNFEVRKGNTQVHKFHKMTGSVKTGETDLDILYRATPESHEIGKRKMIKLLKLQE